MNSIKITNPSQRLIRSFGRGGQFVELDIDDDFSVRMSKALEQVTEFNRVSQEAALSNSLPLTSVNRQVLAVGQMFEVEVTYRGQVLAVDRILVVEMDDSIADGRIEIEIFGSGWYDDLEALRLRDIDLGTFDFTNANVLATWSDREALAYPGLAHYGTFYQNRNDLARASRRDIRFWFNLFGLMKKAMCEIGWTIESPFYDGEYGKHFYGYLSGERWFSYDNKQHPNRSDLNIPAPQVLAGNPTNVVFSVVNDPAGAWNTPFRPLEWLYSTVGELADLRVIISNLTVTLPPPPSPPSDPVGTFVVAVYRNMGGEFEFVFSETVQGNPGEEVTLTLNYDFIVERGLEAGFSYGVVMGYGDILQIGSGNYYGFTLESCEVSFSPDVYWYVPDDVIGVADVIDESVNGADLFNALAKMIAGKVKTNYADKKVTLYPPFDTAIFDENIEGFFQRSDNVIDLSDQVVPNSRVKRYNQDEQERFVLLKFQDSSDGFIDASDGDKQPYQRRVDLGFGVSETLEIEIDLFEPTRDVQTDVSEVGEGLAEGVETPFLPALWEGDRGELSFDTGFRIAYNYGLIRQRDTDGNYYELNFEGVVRETFGYLSQSPRRTINDGTADVRAFPVTFVGFQYDLYQLFYRKWLRELYPRYNYEFLIFLDSLLYERIDFRRPVGILYNDAFLLYQLTVIRDFELDPLAATVVEAVEIDC